MKFTQKRKTTTAKSIKQSISKLGANETWTYNAGKLPADDYHQLPFLSAHVVKDFANKNLSDYYLWCKYIKRNLPDVDSSNFVVGRAFHTAVLEPKIYNDEYAVEPKLDRRTKQGKADAAEWEASNQGKQVLKLQQHEQVQAMAAVVRSNKFVKAIMQGCSNEVSAFRRLDSVLLKGRIDSVNLENRYGWDLKSAEDVSPAGFSTACARYRYDIQAYVYMKLFDLDEFIFVVCNKANPIEVAVYTLSDEFMDKAAVDYEEALQRWVRVSKSVSVPESFTTEQDPMITLAPPKWFTYS